MLTASLTETGVYIELQLQLQLQMCLQACRTKVFFKMQTHLIILDILVSQFNF